MDKTSESLFALKPVTFRYKQQIDPERALSFGLIAEEVAEVSPDLVTRDEKGKPETVRYEAVNAMLLNEFLKEHPNDEGESCAVRGHDPPPQHPRAPYARHTGPHAPCCCARSDSEGPRITDREA